MGRAASAMTGKCVFAFLCIILGTPSSLARIIYTRLSLANFLTLWQTQCNSFSLQCLFSIDWRHVDGDQVTTVYIDINMSNLPIWTLKQFYPKAKAR